MAVGTYIEYKYRLDVTSSIYIITIHKKEARKPQWWQFCVLFYQLRSKSIIDFLS